MFYTANPSSALRFGDIVRGFVSATPNMMRPNISGVPEKSAFSLDVSHSPFSVILSPCCSIGNKVISLAPLIRIQPSFLSNPYFAEDLTRVNREMNPEQTLPQDTWDNLPDFERQKRLAAGRGYAVMDCFIFAAHDLLPLYELKPKGGEVVSINDYMVDFRQIYQVKCDKVNTAIDAPIDAKYLELSVSTRKELREKIANYYIRTPQEDMEELAV